MKVYLGADHGGFTLKSKLLDYLESLNTYEVQDLGAPTLNEEDDYTKYAEAVAQKVSEDESSIGILICRSGIGMCIAANKYKNIYAALCFTETHAIKAKQHNNANILCLDSDYGSKEDHFKITKTFLENSFEGFESRHGRRVSQIKEIETTNFK